MVIQKGSRAIEVDEELIEEIMLSRDGGLLIEVKPYRDSDRGISDTVEMYRSYHNKSQWRGKNVSPTNSFEVWYDGKNARFFIYIDDKINDVQRAVRHVSSNFPGAKIEVPFEASEQTIPRLREGEYFVVTDLKLSNHYFEPVRSPDGVEAYTDPYRNILPEIIENKSVRCMVQVLFKPAGTGWTTSKYEDAAEYAEGLANKESQADIREYGDDEPAKGPSELGKYASLIKRQIDQPGFYVNLRILTISEDKENAIKENNAIAKDYEQYYRAFSGQSFTSYPQLGDRAKDLLYDMVSREGINMDRKNGFVSEWIQDSDNLIIMTIPELAALAHFPNEETLNTNAIDWEKLDTTNRLPTKAPKYDEFKEKGSEKPEYESADVSVDDTDSE